MYIIGGGKVGEDEYVYKEGQVGEDEYVYLTSMTDGATGRQVGNLVS